MSLYLKALTTIFQDLSNDEEIVVHLPDFDPVDVQHFINSIYGWREHKDDIFITQLHKLLQFGTHLLNKLPKLDKNVDVEDFMDDDRMETLDINGDLQDNLDKYNDFEVVLVVETIKDIDNRELKAGTDDQITEKAKQLPVLPHEVNSTELKSSVNNQAEKKFQCTFCKIFCTSRGNLRRHLIADHNQLKPSATKIEIIKEKSMLDSEDSTGESIETPSYQSATNSKFAQEPTNERDLSSTSVESGTLHQKKKKNITVQCEECGAAFISESGYKKHKETFHEGKRYFCNQCDFSGIGYNKLMNHKRKHHSEAKYQCDQCDFVSILKSTLKTHNKTKHLGVTFTCDRCDFYGKAHQLKTHIRKVHEQRRFPCDSCDKVFVTIDWLRQHKNAKHDKIGIPCPKCDVVSINKTAFRRHTKLKHNPEGIRIESKNENITYLCDQCDYTTPYQSCLKNHIDFKHLGRTFPCDKCDYVGIQAQALRKHRNLVHLQIRFPCDTCDKIYKSKDALLGHKNAAHNDIQFPCPTCEEIFKTVQNLRRHIRLKHKAPVIQCEFCDYSTTNNDHFKFHTIHKHSDLKFKCNLCRYDTIKAEYLDKHMKLKHVNEH